ncbi:uncharacterized protein LOC134822581 [Bolinopsis microptera]|uniref:uncharacterized protein LOC134822581 n=1 Tax=Bolinopsis microptera TaxID=2820187 RepID=UPI003078D90C
MKLFIFAALLGVTLASDAELNGVVHLTPDGSVDISGTIKFVFGAQGQADAGKIYVNVAIPGTVDYTMKLHEFLTDFSKKDPVDYIGGVMTGNVATAVSNLGLIRTANKGDNVAATTFTPSETHVVGRTIALYDTVNDRIVACFPILADATSTYYRSKIMEKEGINGEVTMIRSKLAAPNSGYRLSSNLNLLEPGLDAHLHSIQIGTQAITVQQSCTETGNNFFDIHTWGNTSPGTAIKEYYSNTGNGDILGTTGAVPQSLLVKENYPVFAGRSNRQATCNPVYQIKSKSATAHFNQEGSEFSVSFEQESPFHPVEITVSGMPAAINTLTVSKTVVSDYARPRYEAQYTSVSTACALLWDKRETRVDTEALIKANYATNQITMYGPKSILGKAFLFKVGDVSYCADIKNDNTVIREIADFHGLVGGNVILEQDANNRWDDVTVYNSLYSDTERAVALYLTTTKGNEDNTLVNRCPSPSSWNPFYAYNVGGDLGVNSVCTSPDYYYNCPRGYTQTRMGLLEVQKLLTGEVKFTQVLHDPFLQMSGDPNTIIPSNIVLTYTTSGSVTRNNLDCAALKKVGGMTAEAIISEYDTDTKKSLFDTDGSVKFSYDDSSNSMTWTAAFSSILGATTSLTLNEKRVATSESGYPFLACSEEVLGNVLNFNNAEGSDAPSGNLSAIDDMFKGNAKTISQSSKTAQYDFFSPSYSPMYSSIRLGYGNNDEPYSCANMNPVLSTGKSEKHLYALFYKQPSHGKVSGEIKFRQVTVKTDTGTFYYPTNLEINLGHWHHPKMMTDSHRIYITKYDSCSDFPNGSIRPSEDIYNPYSVPVQHVKNGEFPHYATVGDVTAKSEQYVALGKRMMINVDNLPLTGKFSILGKAIVISDSIGNNFIGCTVITDNRVNSGVTLTVSVVTLLSSLFLALW